MLRDAAQMDPPKEASGAVASCDWLDRPEHAINVSANGLEFFPQHLISFNRVASDFLIDVGGHSGQICDVRLQARLAITHWFGQKLRSDRVDAIQSVAVVWRVAQFRLCVSNTGCELVNAG